MDGLPDLAIALKPELRFILDLGVAVALALVGGAIAVRLRQPPIVGYLLAGVVIGPFTPGFVGDQEQINALAELGVVLLLFALGVEFNLRELAKVRRVVVPGAIGQIVITTVVAGAATMLLGLEPLAAVVVGAAVAISSTIVVLKILMERGELDALHGRTAIGWMIVQDLATIVLMALLEPLAGGDVTAPLLFALLKPAGLPRALPPVGVRHSAPRGVRVQRRLRPVAGAGCLRGRDRRLGVGPLPPGRGRDHAVP
jgi:CPA2 family monovalent cation:H+ antiporter-2